MKTIVRAKLSRIDSIRAGTMEAHNWIAFHTYFKTNAVPMAQLCDTAIKHTKNSPTKFVQPNYTKAW